MDGEDLGTLYEEVGERFGIEFDYYLGEAGTVGDLYHYILWKLGLEKRDTACLCPPTFFALRKVLVEQLGADSITLDTKLASLLPWWRRRKTWQKLGDAMDLEFPKLEDLPGAAVGAALAWVAVCLPLTVLLVAWLIDENSTNWQVAASVLLGLCLQVPFWLLLVRTSRSVQIRLPYHCRTVGQLVDCLVVLNPNQPTSRYRPEHVDENAASHRSRCTYLTTFLRIRKALAGTTGHDPRGIQGSTHLSEIVGRFGRRSTWRLLQFNLRWELPELVRSRFVVGVCVAGYVGILVANIRQLTDTPLIWWLIIPYAILAYLCTIPLAVHFPKDCRTVNDLAVSVVDLNYGQIAGAYDSLNSREIWASLQRLISQTASVNVDDVTLEMPLLDAVTK